MNTRKLSLFLRRSADSRPLERFFKNNIAPFFGNFIVFFDSLFLAVLAHGQCARFIDLSVRTNVGIVLCEIYLAE